MKAIYIDLDGTFVKSDLLIENFLSAFKKNKLVIFYCFTWLFKGISTLKYELAKRSDVSASNLVINEEVHEFIKQRKAEGSEIILATASTQIDAEKIVKEFEVFDRYLCSTPEVNLKSKRKLDAILSETDDFSYIGNSKDDFTILDVSTEPYLANPSIEAERKNREKNYPVLSRINVSAIKLWAKQLRIYQWVKNSLIFVPIFVSANFFDINLLLLTVLAFFSFSLLASATYQINDLLDLDADRIHARKRFRPLASGDLDIVDVVKVTAVTGLIAILLAALAGAGFLLTLLGYLVLTLSYSTIFKRYFGMDVILLALLYTIRIFAGAAVIDVVVSFWLLSFSMFVFFSLALVKRCSEIKAASISNKAITGREYTFEDYIVLMAFGICSALLALLTFCFYSNSNVLVDQYQQPDLLWLAVPVLGYWLMRMWIKTNRNEMHDDPIVFALKDRGSLICIATIGVTFILAHVL